MLKVKFGLLLSSLVVLFAVSSLAWQHDGVYSVAPGERKLHDFGPGGRVEKLFLSLANVSDKSLSIEVIEVMGVIACAPSIDGIQLERPFFDSNSFTLMSASKAKVLLGEKVSQMDENDLLLVEEGYEHEATFTVVSRQGDKYQIKSSW